MTGLSQSDLQRASSDPGVKAESNSAQREWRPAFLLGASGEAELFCDYNTGWDPGLWTSQTG